MKHSPLRVSLVLAALVAFIAGAVFLSSAGGTKSRTFDEHR
jgi:hypothetical protein